VGAAPIKVVVELDCHLPGLRVAATWGSNQCRIWILGHIQSIGMFHTETIRWSRSEFRTGAPCPDTGLVSKYEKPLEAAPNGSNVL